MSEPRGVIYVMTSAIDGLVKIGKTSTDRFEARMQYLESNGYSNITGLQRLVAIEVDNYHKKEQLLHEVFSKHRIGRSEFFALDEYLIQRLLLALDGTQIYPKPTQSASKADSFEAVTTAHQQDQRFSFYKKGIEKGASIHFIKDPTITAVVAGPREVSYGGKTWRLSALTRLIYTQRGEVNNSGAYRGADHWMYGGVKLTKLMDKIEEQ